MTTPSETDVENAIALAKQAVHLSQDNILDTALLLKRVQETKAQIDRRLKIESVFVLVAVAAFLGCLVLRFG